MTHTPKHLIVADVLLKIFKKGLILNEKALHFIDSTFLSPSADALQAIINDPANCEREVLVQLIFFPGDPVQLQLEPLLETHPFSIQDEALLLDYLKHHFQGISISLPNGREAFSITSDSSSYDHGVIRDLALEHFVYHLNCLKKLPDNVISVIDNHVPEAKKIWTKIRLRNARFDFTAKNTIWLCSFFEAAYKFDGIYDDVLHFAIEFVDNLAETDDIYNKLMALKRAYFKAMEKNKAFEAQMQKSNMETMIMQGKRGSGMGTETARKKIILIDRISYAVYRKTEPIEPFVTENEIDTIQTDADMQNVMKFLGT